MLDLPHRLLIGPLFNPALIGRYADAENVRLFMPESSWSRNYRYDLVYDPDRIEHFNQIFAGLSDDWQPDLVIWWDPVYQPIPPGIEDCPYPLALIPGDWNLAFSTILQTAQAVDGVFADARLGPILRQAGLNNIHIWPGFAYDASQVYAEPEQERRHDVCFIGNMNPNIHPRRSRFLAQLLSLKDRYRLFLRHGVWGADYRHALNQSRIVLNYTICQVMNMRAYEAPACGALLFIEEDNREVRAVFRDRESCVLYNEANLLPLVEYYLEHEEERAAIAAEGQRIVQNYSYERHFERLLIQIPDVLAQRPSQRPIQQQSPQQRYLQNLNQISSSNPEGARLAENRLVHVWHQLGQQLERDRLWELNALLVMLFPHIDEHQQLQAIYHISLETLLRGFETGLALDIGHPILRYHHGLTCEYLGDETQALWSYSQSIELMAGGRVQDVLSYRDFILPFNKSGRGTDQLAFEWERISYESLEQGISPLPSYLKLLVSSIWQRIGRILVRQGRRAKALIAYQNAHENFPRANLLLEIAKLQLREPDQLRAGFASCQAMLELQPLLVGALPELVTPELLLCEAAWLYQQTDRFVSLFPELNRLRQLAALVLAAENQQPYDWQALLEIPFSADFYQWLCRILQCFESAAALKPLQILRQPWGLHWDLPLETAPDQIISCGFYWSAAAPALGVRPQQRFQRSYDGPSDWRQGRCGPDHFPFAFTLEPSSANPLIEELLQPDSGAIVAILAGWNRQQLSSLLQGFALHWHADSHQELLLFCPPGSQLTLADLEGCLPENTQAPIVWLDEELAAADQALLLSQAQRVLTSPLEQGLFYSYWAAALKVPIVWIQAPQWLPQQGQNGFRLQSSATAAEALHLPAVPPPELPLHWREAKLREQAWLNALWKLRLWTQLS